MAELNNVKLEWPNHKNIFIESLWNSFSNQFLFDFEIVCEEKSFGAHAVILSALCEVFNKFKSDTSSKRVENPCQQFEISGIDGELGKCFLEFLYRGKTSFPPDSLKPFLALLKQAKIRGLDELEVNYPAKNSENVAARDEENSVTIISNAVATPEVICLDEDDDEAPARAADEPKDNAADLFSAEQYTLDDISIVDSFQIDSDINIEESFKPEELFEDVSTACRTTIEDVISVIENEKSTTFSFNGVYSSEKKTSVDDTSREKASVEESVKSPGLVISKTTHFCECSFNVPTLKDRQVCSLGAVLRHCGCRLDECLFSVSFSTNDDNLLNESGEKCCLCSSDLPIAISAKPVDSKETTKTLLGNYLDQMMDLSLSLDEDLEIITDRPIIRKDAFLRSMLEAKQPLPSSPFPWLNKFSPKPRERNDLQSTSTQTEILLPEDEATVEKVRCHVCKSDLPGQAAFDLHMITAHSCKLSPTREIRKRLVCSYCDFRAVSIRLLACHLTEVHKGMVVTGESPTSTDRVLRSRTQTNKPLSITPSPVKLERKETYTSESDCDSNERNVINEVAENQNMEVENDLTIVGEKNKRDLGRKIERPPVKRKLQVKKVVKKRLKLEFFKDGDEMVDMENVAEPKTLNCEKCGFNTTSLFGLKCHRLEHTGPAPFLCETCKVNFVSKSALIMHMLNHATPEDFYKCGYCKFMTPFKTRIDLHERQQHNAKLKFKCHFCKKWFNSRKACDVHRRIHYQHNSSMRRTPQLELPTKKKNTKFSKQFLCPKCEFIAAEAKLLYRHVYENHLGEA